MRISWIAATLAGALSGCSTPPGGFDSPVPAERLNAVAKAARERDKSAVPKIVPLLASDDPAVRLASIRTLELLTGETLGYDHAAPEWKRREMVQLWVEWCNRQGSGERPVNTGGMVGSRSGSGAGGAGNADTVR